MNLYILIFRKLRQDITLDNKLVFSRCSTKPFSCPPQALLRLKEAEEARSLCVSIETLECSGELVQALQQHSTCMTDLFRQLNKLTTDGCDDMTKYQPLFDQAAQYSTWYVKRTKVANSMKQAATSS